MEEFVQFIIEDAYIMIAVLWVIGYIIKNTEAIADKWIPVILIVLSIGFTPLLLGAYTAVNIAQAVLVAGGAVLIDQVKKQLQKPE